MLDSSKNAPPPATYTEESQNVQLGERDTPHESIYTIFRNRSMLTRVRIVSPLSGG